MTRQLYAQSGAATSNWRQAVQEVKQEVLQCGGASLPALCNCLDQFPGGSWSDLAMLAQDLALIGQQLHALSHQHTSTGDALQTTQQQQQQQPSLQQQQDQQQAVAPADVLPACIRFCKAVTDALAAILKPHKQPRQHTRWQHPQHHRQQQQQQHVQRHLLPAAAATALCSCLRQWADPMLLPAACQHSTGLQETDLPQAAVVTLGALLPSQLPVISAHERAAVLALLLAIVQPPMHSSTGTSTAGGSSSGSNTMTAAAGPRQHGQEQHHHMQDTQHWALACKAVVALTDTMSEALRSSSAATAASSSSKQAVGSGAAAAGLRPEEAASIIAGLVEALSTSCGIRGGSSSRGGSTASAAAGSHSASGTRSGSTGGSSGGTSINSSKQQPVEGLVQSQYYASLLVALNHAVNSKKQGWHSHAGAITESARKLFTYGTQQQLQQQGKEVQGSTAASTVPAAKAAANSSGSPAAAIGQSTTAASPQPPKTKYVPPHARAAAAAVQSPSKQLQQQQQQQWQESSDESEQSASDWSDVSDSEYLQGGSSRRASSSSSRDRNQHKQQQQQLHDPIKAVRVRSALLQLLQVLIQADPSALHPYWAALLPSQAPLQQAPLSPNLLTMLLYDPSDKVRLLAAAVLGALLEGPTARSLLAVAEAKTAHPTLRGFTTMSVSLGHMLISLHAGLLAVITAWQQQQQQQGVLQVPPVLLTSVLHVLCALVPVTPYERLPSTLLTDVVDRVWQLWNVLQPQASAAAAAAVQLSTALPGGNGTAGVGVPRLALSAAAPSAGPAGAEASPGHNSSSNSSAIVAVIAVLAQALSTKKPLPALGRWLSSSSSSSITNSGSNSNTTSSRGSALISGLLAAAGAPDCLLRIEALAALRGCCINYPAAVTALIAHAELQQTVEGERTPDSSSNCHGSSSSGGEQAHCWQQLLGVVGVSVAAAAQPASARSTPRSSPRVSDAADTPAAAGDGSGSTSPEVKAGQHAVRLLGDWLTAAAAGNASAAGDASTAVVANGGQQPQQQQQQRQDGVNQLGSQWESVLQLLLSGSVWHHPSPVIRSAAAAVCGMIPAKIWLVVPHALREQLLAAAAGTAAGADVTAVRAAACKLLGSCAVMPGVMGQQQQQQQQCPEQQMLQALTQCVSDEAVSVRLSAAWALANVCDELRQQLETMPVGVARVVGSDQTASGSAANKAQQQQRRQQQQQRSVADASGRPIMGPAVLRLLCDAAVAAAGDTEKVRAHGVRAVGALLAAWQRSWGLATSSTTTTTSSSSSSAHLSTSPAAAAAGAPEDWSWVLTWFKAAFGALQSCLAARSMKVVWNAACAAAAGLQNWPVLTIPVVADSTPGLLRMLVVLVRDSSNYKIKTHAAAALAAPAHRAAYGEVYGDVLLVVLAALQGLNSSSSSSSSAAPSVTDAGSSGAAAADGRQSVAGGADGLDEEGAFPNYRYIPGLQAQLEASLCHLLALLQPSDSTKLREQLKRNQQLLLTALAKCAESAGGAHAGQQRGAGFAAAGAGATEVTGGLERGEEQGRGGKQQNVIKGVDGTGASLPASRAVECGASSQQRKGAEGQAAMQQQQQQVKSTLPVDPFGQEARQSGDGSAVVTSIRGSTAAGAAGGTTGKAAAAGDGNQSTADASDWCKATYGVGLNAAGATGVEDSCGAGAGITRGSADGGVGVSEGVQAALKGLDAVLGPAVVAAWTKQQMQV